MLLDRPFLVIGILLLSILVLAGLSVGYLTEVAGGVALVTMVLLGAGSRIPQRFSGGDIGIELCMLFMVCTVLRVGLGAGLVVGLGGLVLSAFVTREPPQDVFVALLGFGLIGFMVNSLGFWGEILTMGVAYTLLYDVLTGTAYLFMGHTPFGMVKFTLTHLVWNFVVFRAMGPWLLALL